MTTTITREEFAHIQQLVRDLVQGDSKNSQEFDQTPYIIKQVFQSGKEDVFADQLSFFASRKESEIEKVCSLHYQVYYFHIRNL